MNSDNQLAVDAEYPYKELQKIGQGSEWSTYKVLNKKDLAIYKAKKVKLELNSRTLSEWNSIQHLEHKMIIEGKECFYDPSEQMLTMIMENCECKSFL